jgi:hypothetical protein
VRLFAFCWLLLRAALHGQPAQDYILQPDAKFTSPDGRFVVEQYHKLLPSEQEFVVQEWIFDSSRQHATLLNRNETGTICMYAAEFCFSHDSQWLVRMQKVAAGESTLFLYHRVGLAYVPATARPLGDLAWDFLGTQVDMPGPSQLSQESVLIDGFGNNYAQLGEHWPDSRYLLIDLYSGESDTYPFGWWRCRYDMETGEFSIPPEFAKANAATAAKVKADQQDWLAKHKN